MNFSISPVKADQVKLGNYVLINKRPCRIVECNHAITGKHGHAKVMLVGMDILSNKKHSYMSHGDATMLTFKPIKVDYQLLDIVVARNEKDNLEAELSCLTPQNQEIKMTIKSDLFANNNMTTIIKQIQTAFANDSNVVTVKMLYAPYEINNTPDQFDQDLIITGFELSV